jgi:hypothetical protein
MARGEGIVSSPARARFGPREGDPFSDVLALHGEKESWIPFPSADAAAGNDKRPSLRLFPYSRISQGLEVASEKCYVP